MVRTRESSAASTRSSRLVRSVVTCGWSRRGASTRRPSSSRALRLSSTAPTTCRTRSATERLRRILTVDDIPTSPLSSTSFDGWIDNRVRRAVEAEAGRKIVRVAASGRRAGSFRQTVIDREREPSVAFPTSRRAVVQPLLYRNHTSETLQKIKTCPWSISFSTISRCAQQSHAQGQQDCASAE